ncbi:MAG: DNA ligase [Actinobacteria bacterium]|nr:DNA ligase [Actinomycetota bacterium]
MTLREYQRKRKFDETPEPEGEQNGGGESPVFVVQKHRSSHLHYDFRLEVGGVLKSWAIPKGLSLNPKQKHLAVMVEDHPLDYKDFEGVITEGNYGAGTVMIWDRGTYRIPMLFGKQEIEKKINSGLAGGHITFILNGQKLRGEFALVRLRKSKEDNAWLLIKKNDEFASEVDITEDDRSVLSGRSLDEIKD